MPVKSVFNPTFILLLQILLATTSIGSFFTIRNTVDAGRSLVHTQEVARELNHVLVMAARVRSASKDFLLTQNPFYLGIYSDQHNRIYPLLNHIKQLTKDDPNQQKNLEKLNNSILLQQKFIDSYLVAFDEGGIDSAIKVIKTDLGRLYMMEIQDIGTKMIQEEDMLLNIRMNNAKFWSNVALWAIPAIFMIALILIAVNDKHIDINCRVI